MVKYFEAEEWKSQTDKTYGDFAIMISFSEHQIEEPIIQVYSTNNNEIYSKIIADFNLLETKDVIIFCDNPYKGKVVIK